MSVRVDILSGDSSTPTTGGGDFRVESAGMTGRNFLTELFELRGDATGGDERDQRENK